MMNVIFTAVFLASAAVLCISSPDNFIPALLDGAQKSAAACLTLFGVYAVWMGLSRVAAEAGINGAIARKLRPFCFKLFRTKDEKGAQYAAMNITCNLLGLGGAATPFGIKAAGQFEAEGNKFAANMLFIVNATSVQLIPSTVISLRAAEGSASPADIFLPALITTAVCTGLAVTIYMLCGRSCQSSSLRSL